MIPVLTTDRLTLRAPCIEDFEPWAEILMSDRGQYIGGPFDRQGAWDDLCRETASWVLRGYGGWSVEANGTYIGMIGLHHELGDPERELGWVLNAAGEGHGYAFEGASAARTYALKTLGWDTLVSYIDPANERSITLAQKLGATRDEDAQKPDDYPNCFVYRHAASGHRQEVLQ